MWSDLSVGVDYQRCWSDTIGVEVRLIGWGETLSGWSETTSVS